MANSLCVEGRASGWRALHCCRRIVAKKVGVAKEPREAHYSAAGRTIGVGKVAAEIVWAAAYALDATSGKRASARTVAMILQMVNTAFAVLPIIA